MFLLSANPADPITLRHYSSTPGPCPDNPPWTVYLHHDFENWLFNKSVDPHVQKKARYCLLQLLSSGRSGRSKPVVGPARGWLRTPLAGTAGSHYYLWWAGHDSMAVEGLGLKPGEILVRCVRHHDETSRALSGEGARSPLPPDFLDPVDDQTTAFTDEQRRAALPSAYPVRFLKGSPGSGKTTSLHLATRFITGGRMLYLTYSRGLARQAEEQLRAFGPAGVAPVVMTFEELFTELRGPGLDPVSLPAPQQGANLLEKALSDYRGQYGPWKGRFDELFTEIYAHILGHSLPIPFRGRPAEASVLPTWESYVGRRREVLDEKSMKPALQVAGFIHERSRLEAIFTAPVLSWQLLQAAETPPPRRFEGVGSVFIDEVQDLTPVECFLVLNLVARIATGEGVMPSLVIAGD